MRRRIFVYIIFALAFVLYLYTLELGVGLIDSGELAMAGSGLGIAHPTGYPLYVLFTRLFCLLPIASVLATNLMSLFFGALAGVVVYLFLLPKKHDIWKELICAGIALVFLSLRTLWGVSVITEVYALEIFLDVFMVYLFFKGFRDNPRFLIIASLLAGLSFGNHMHTVLYAPSIFFLLFTYRKQLTFRFFGYLILAFLVGLLVYLFLPLRAMASPDSNWGNPATWDAFWRHVSGWQYRVWMFEKNAGALGQNISLFWSIYTSQLFGLLPILTILGFAGLVIARKFKELVFFLILGIVDFVYSINYSIPDIDAYYLPLFFASIAIFGLGVQPLFAKIPYLKKRTWIAFVLVSILVFVAVFSNFEFNNRSKDSFAQDLAYTFLDAAPKDALVIVDNWDIYAPAMYLQWETGYRNDLVLVDFPLLKRSWYVNKLLQDYPSYFGKSQVHIVRFVKEVVPFENREDHNPQRIENAYREMIFSMVGYNIAEGKDVVTFLRWEPLQERFTAKKSGIYEIYTENKGVVLPAAFCQLPELKNLDERKGQLIERITRNMAGAVFELSQQGDYDNAIELGKAILKTDPMNTGFIQNIAVLHLQAEKFALAKKWFARLEGHIPPKRMQIIYNDIKKRERASILKNERNRQ